jgi:hypothetical protein
MAKTSSDCFQTCDSNSVYRLLVRLVNTQCKDLDEEVSLFNQHKIFFFSPTRFLQLLGKVSLVEKMTKGQHLGILLGIVILS